MPRRLLLVLALALATLGAGAQELSKLLDVAEAIRPTDKPKSRQMLDRVNAALEKHPDSLLIARAQLLECKWADTPPPAYRAVEIGLAAAAQAKNVALQGRLIACRATAHWSAGEEADAERDYKQALTLSRQAKDVVSEADVLRHLGELQYTRGVMADALTNLQAAYRLNERLGREKDRLDALAGIANVYADAQVGQYDRAIEYYKQLAADYEKHGQANDVADTLFNIAATYGTKGDFAAAEFHYRRALAIFETLRLPGDIAYTQRALGLAIVKQGRSNDALPLFNAALAYYDKTHSAGETAIAHQYRGMAYRRLGRLNEALQELGAARAYFERENNVRFLEKNIEETSLVHEQLGDWRHAYDFRKRHSELQQTLAAARRDEISSRLRVEFDAEKKEQENRALARENALRIAALDQAQRNEKLQRIVIGLTALLATTLAVLFWRQVAYSRRVRTMALTDELTQLPNRRHILAEVGSAFASAKRNSRAAALIVFDIDRFKRINDTYGHAAGDLVLKTIASTCKQALRPNDRIGRIGGEEFLIVLHDASAAQARDIAERLRHAVEQLDFSTIEPGLQVTISLGVHVTEQYDIDAAIAAADTLLYRAKSSGRNRVELDVTPLTASAS